MPHNIFPRMKMEIIPVVKETGRSWLWNLVEIQTSQILKTGEEEFLSWAFKAVDDAYFAYIEENRYLFDC